MHALIENGSIIRVGPRPDWRDGDTGAPLTDEQWISHGWVPVLDEETDHDPSTHYLVARPSSDWIVEADRVVRAFDVVALPPQPEPQPNPVPEIVSMRQAKIQLSRAGLLVQANAAIEALEGQPGEEARLEWEYATSLRRDHPLVAGIGRALGLDNAAKDDLFRAAALIP